MGETENQIYRQLPSVDDLLRREDIQPLIASCGRPLVTHAVRDYLASLRRQLREGVGEGANITANFADVCAHLARKLQRHTKPRLRRVINATGVILQTNLGRAPLSRAALDHVQAVCAGYCNLEYDLAAGERGMRDAHAETLLLKVLQARGVDRDLSQAGARRKAPLAAAVVNNCAAATFLALNTLAEGGEVIVSRGELVEIGGGFRIPDILAKSGCTLREVGTTNKTRISDYANAIGPATRLLLRVHRSNFRIEGFTEQPALEALIALSRTSGVPLFDDQGTGALVELDKLGCAGESSWLNSLQSGAALVASSGDKLLGGPQCGLLVGEEPWIERMRRNPLFRVLRIDKMSYAALEATLLAYLTNAEDSLPIVHMLRLPAETIARRCGDVVRAVQDYCQADVVSVQSVIGGGTTPGATLPSYAVRLGPRGESERELAAILRALHTPVISRISDGHVLLDLRTVREDEDAELAMLLQGALASSIPAQPNESKLS